jgi:DNA-binding MarR family transcriptional regulator
MEPQDLDLPTLVSLAGDGVVREVLSRIAQDGYDGVRPSHGYVIQRLVENEPTITSLAASLGMTQQGASKQVRELERLGYVERVPVAGDARARRVRLSERGHGVLAAGRAARTALETEVARRAGPEETEVARRVLATMLEVVGLGDDVRRRSVPLPQRDA